MPQQAGNEPPWTRRSLKLRGDVPLRSCPFCSSTELGLYEYTYAKVFAVDCRRCGAQGPRNSSARKAQALWNGRADEAAKGAG